MAGFAALIVAVSAFLTAVGGLIAVLRRQDAAHTKLDSIEDTLNHTDHEIGSEGKITLGQRVVALQASVDAGQVTNAREHDLLADGHHQLGQRLDQIRRDVTEVQGRVADHDRWEHDRLG